MVGSGLGSLKGVYLRESKPVQHYFLGFVVQDQLNSMTKEFTSTAAAAQRTLRGLFGGKAASAAPVPEGVPTAKLRPGYGAASPEGTAQERAARGLMKRVTLAEFGSAIGTATPQKAQPVIKQPGAQLYPYLVSINCLAVLRVASPKDRHSITLLEGLQLCR